MGEVKVLTDESSVMEIRELLKDAYAILDGIPQKNIDLDDIVTHGNPRNPGCNTLACGIGWLGMHPEMGERLNIRIDREGWVCARSKGGRSIISVVDILPNMHLISRFLFCRRDENDEETSVNDDPTDKDLLLARFRYVLEITKDSKTGVDADYQLDRYRGEGGAKLFQKCLGEVMAIKRQRAKDEGAKTC